MCEEVRERIHEYLSIHSSEKDSSEIQWIKGWGWDQTLWPSKSFPTHVSECKFFL